MNKKGITALAVIAAVLLAVVVGVFIAMDSNDMGETLGSGEQTTGDSNGANGENGTGNAGSNSVGNDANSDETETVELLSEVIEVSGYEWDDSAMTTIINLGNGGTGSSVTASGDGVKISGSDILIEDGGQYEITGTLVDGRIVIDAKKENVYIKLNNANISCSYSSAIYGYKADKLVLVLADGSENNLTDVSDYDYSDDYSNEEETVPNACIYAKMDLLICGSGKLNVTGNCERGITGKDNLDIADANINVVSVGKAILGKDRLAVSNATIEAESVDDALHSNGNVLLDGGKYILTSEDDAIHADASVVTDGADITINGSEEGIEGWQVYLLNSEITVNSNDDGINAANGSSEGMGFGGFGGGQGGFGGGQGGFGGGRGDINDGLDGIGGDQDGVDKGHGGGFGGNRSDFEEGQDGFDKGQGGFGGQIPDIGVGELPDIGVDDGQTLPDIGDGQIPEINGDRMPDMGAGQAPPNMGAGQMPNMNGGQLQFDDSVMPALPSSTNEQSLSDTAEYAVSQMATAAAAPDSSVSSPEIKIVIKNSNIYINAGGDGIDSNGSIYMDGGTVIVYGPSNSGDGGIDYETTFELVSGTLLVVDVTGMTMVPSTCELQGIDVTLNQNLSAGDVVCVSSDDYSYCFEIIKKSNHFTLITSEMKTGDSVTVFIGGSYSGSFDEYLVSGDGYSGGNEAATLTLENGITSYGSRGGFGRF